MKKISLLLMLALMGIMHSCYYDNFDSLHPGVTLSGCDTTGTISYSTNVNRIVKGYCTSCHNAQTLSGNVRLDTYEGIYTQAKNGKLLGAIKHLPGYKPMPPGTQIETCKIRTIEKWVSQGALNN